jgi:hypothetical protein
MKELKRIKGLGEHPMPDNSDNPLLDILPYCTAEQLGLQGLACLAASSKQLRTISLGFLPKDGSMLLPALEAAAKARAAELAALPPKAAIAGAAQAALAGASRAEKEYKQRIHAVEWLLLHTPTAAVAEGVADRALQVPLPVHRAKLLLAAGMTITYAQLLHAADSMAEGLERWLQAQWELRLQTDIPQAAYDICIYVSWVSTLQQ